MFADSAVCTHSPLDVCVGLCVCLRPAGRVQVSSRVCLVTVATRDPEKTKKSIYHRLSASLHFLSPRIPIPKITWPDVTAQLSHTIPHRHTHLTQTDTHTQTSLQLNYSAEPEHIVKRGMRQIQRERRE